MNIGIIVYSQTGNTLSVAEKLKSALEAEGHAAAIERITIEGQVEPGKPITLTNKPDPSKYDALVFAAPVMAFSLNPAMKAYLAQAGGVKGKRAACFTTQQLSASWLGGNRALRTMCAALEAKGAQAFKGGIVHWKEEQKRSANTEETLKAICGGLQ